jgi:hypothetical protein
MITKPQLESVIARWDRRNRNHHAGAIALLRLDEAWDQYEGGYPLEMVLRHNFNDYLLTMLLTEVRT